MRKVKTGDGFVIPAGLKHDAHKTETQILTLSCRKGEAVSDPGSMSRAYCPTHSILND